MLHVSNAFFCNIAKEFIFASSIASVLTFDRWRVIRGIKGDISCFSLLLSHRLEKTCLGEILRALQKLWKGNGLMAYTSLHADDSSEYLQLIKERLFLSEPVHRFCRLGHFCHGEPGISVHCTGIYRTVLSAD